MKHANAEKDRWTIECVTPRCCSCKGSRNEASTTSTSGESTKATKCRKRIKIYQRNDLRSSRLNNDLGAGAT